MDYLKNFLILSFLRPESGLWDALAANVIKQSKCIVKSPSIDFGCGNGLFTYISMGGVFDDAWDWYCPISINDKKMKNFLNGEDIYDDFCLDNKNNFSNFLKKVPDSSFDIGLDHKSNLLKQAELLNYYKTLQCCDANKKWPFADNNFESFFSNIFYWLNDKEFCFSELQRVLKPGGTAMLCLFLEDFKKFAFTYNWKTAEKYNETLRLLNRGREISHKWATTEKELSEICKKNNLEIMFKKKYLSELVVQIWDIGTRCTSDIMIKIFNSLSPEQRFEMKIELVDRYYKLLKPIYDEASSKDEGGFIFVVLRKK